MEKEYSWLNHLDGIEPRSGYGIDQGRFNISLEAWRRGISVKFIRKGNTNIYYILDYNGRKHEFYTTFGDLTSKEAAKIAKNKQLTKQYLIKAGVPVAKGNEFKKKESNEDILDYVTSNLSFPLVIKPSSGMKGKGVVANIRTKQELLESLLYVRNKLGYGNIIVEKHVEGEELRVFFIGDQIEGAYKKIPANVVGDGSSSINDLINEKNKLRKNNPHLYSRLIKVDKELKNYINKLGYGLDSIPMENEVVQLRSQSNLNTGGDLVDITDNLPNNIVEIIKKTANAIPGLPHAGVDLIMGENETIVLEINHNQAVSGHLYPMKGKARDVPKAIIDYYYPETKEITKSLVYFNFKPIRKLLRDKTTKEILLTKPPIGEQFGLSVKVNLKNLGLAKKIKKIVTKTDFSGYLKNTTDNNSELYIVGNNKNKLEKIVKEIRMLGIEMRETREQLKPVEIGFKFIDDAEN